MEVKAPAGTSSPVVTPPAAGQQGDEAMQQRGAHHKPNSPTHATRISSCCFVSVSLPRVGGVAASSSSSGCSFGVSSSAAAAVAAAAAAMMTHIDTDIDTQQNQINTSKQERERTTGDTTNTGSDTPVISHTGHELEFGVAPPSEQAFILHASSVKLQRYGLIFFGINLIVLIICTAIHCHAIQELQSAYNSVAILDNGSPDIRLLQLDTALTEAESSVRGFVIQGEDAYLDRWRRAVPRIYYLMNLLSASIEPLSSPVTDPLVLHVQDAAKLRMQQIDQLAKVRATEGFEAAKQLQARDMVDKTMLKYRESSYRLLTHIRALYTEHLAETSRRFSVTWMTAIIMACFLFLSACLCLLIGRFGASREMFERNRALKQLLDKAEDATRLKSALLQNISHEFLTPMNGVLVATHELMQMQLSNDQRECADNILESAQSMMAMLQDLILCSKLYHGRFRLHIVPFRMVDLIHQLDAFMRSKLIGRRQNIEWRHQVDANVPPCIIADMESIKQILLQFLSNSLKFTTRGVIYLRISVIPACEVHPTEAAQRDNHQEQSLTSNTPTASTHTRNELTPADEVRIGIEEEPPPVALKFSLTDDGIGIELDMQSKIFSAFVQADMSTTKRYGGTGLGLSLCSSICADMGGELQVTSEVNRGSTFSLLLRDIPVTTEEEVQRHQASEIEQPRCQRSAQLEQINEQASEQINQAVMPIDRTNDQPACGIQSAAAEPAIPPPIMVSSGDISSTLSASACAPLTSSGVAATLPELPSHDETAAVSKKPMTAESTPVDEGKPMETRDGHLEVGIDRPVPMTSEESASAQPCAPPIVISAPVTELTCINNAPPPLETSLTASTMLQPVHSGLPSMDGTTCTSVDWSTLSFASSLGIHTPTIQIPLIEALAVPQQPLTPASPHSLQPPQSASTPSSPVFDDDGSRPHARGNSAPGGGAPHDRKPSSRLGLVHPHTKPLHILVAEDHLVNQQVLKKMLTRLGHSVTIANDGREAVEQFKQNRKQFDIILMDICMPNLDGYGASEEIRVLERAHSRSTGIIRSPLPTPTTPPMEARKLTGGGGSGSGGTPGMMGFTPIVAVTAAGAADCIGKCIASGMDDCIDKPLTPKAFTRILQAYRLDQPADASATSTATHTRAHEMQTNASAENRGGDAPAHEPISMTHRNRKETKAPTERKESDATEEQKHQT